MMPRLLLLAALGLAASRARALVITRNKQQPFDPVLAMQPRAGITAAEKQRGF